MSARQTPAILSAPRDVAHPAAHRALVLARATCDASQDDQLPLSALPAQVGRVPGPQGHDRADAAWSSGLARLCGGASLTLH